MECLLGAAEALRQGDNSPMRANERLVYDQKEILWSGTLFVPQFGQHYRVLRYDRYGFGSTVMVAVNYSYHRDLCELLMFLI